MAETITRSRIVTQDNVIDAVREAMPHLRSRGIKAAYLLSPQEPSNLVEIHVDYDADYPFTLITLAELERYLSDLVGYAVELTTLDAVDEAGAFMVETRGKRIF